MLCVVFVVDFVILCVLPEITPPFADSKEATYTRNDALKIEAVGGDNRSIVSLEWMK